MDDETNALEPSGGDPFGLQAGDTVDRYRIQESIGIGGMGVVYRAHDPALDREIALKLVRADRRGDGDQSQARLLREAQAMAQVSHPNVLPIYDVGILGTGVFIAMEYIQGQSLPQWMQEQSRSPEQIVDVFIEAGRGPPSASLVARPRLRWWLALGPVARPRACGSPCFAGAEQRSSDMWILRQPARRLVGRAARLEQGLGVSMRGETMGAHPEFAAYITFPRVATTAHVGPRRDFAVLSST